MTTDELRAKFEAWWKENYFYVHEKLASLKEYAWMGWQAAHASRDAEVEALRKRAFALDALVAAGFVTETKLAESLSIAGAAMREEGNERS